MDILKLLLIIYLVVINLIAIFITVFDKISAKKHKWRVKEKTLLIVSALGGSVGMLLTMLLIRHKTRHLKFMLGIPFIIALQVSLALLLVNLYGK